MLKTSNAQRAAAKRYYLSRKGKATARRYRETPAGRAALKAAQQRYRASPAGREAARRAIERYRKAHTPTLGAVERRELRRRRIALGLPPDVPQLAPGMKYVEESSDPAKMTPAYIAAALALEDLL